MSTIDNNSNNLSVYELINQQNQGSATAKSQASEDSEMFMKLMIAQLQNQDPTSPADTTDFMQQISSMSMVESINNLVTSVETMSSSLLSSQAALQASSMVGRQAFVKTDSGSLTTEGGVEGMVSLETSTPNLRIKVFDASGNQVDTINMGALVAGDHSFKWDGVNQAEGTYRFVAEGKSGDEFLPTDTYIGHTVNSVTLGQNGIGMKVNTDAGSVSLDQVRQLG